MQSDKIKIYPGTKNIGIVLVHGWTANPKQVAGVAELLNQEGYWIFAPLLSGHETKPEDLNNVKWEEWLEDVESAIDFARAKEQISRVVAGGVSLGGNLSLIASTRKKLDGVFLLGSPVHVKNHFWISILIKVAPFFKKYIHKTYPKNTAESIQEGQSYQYFPLVSVKEGLKALKRSAQVLSEITAPLLVVQTNSDYLVAKYSPWVIYNKVKSKTKKLQWIQTRVSSHAITGEEIRDYASVINNFIKEAEKNGFE